MIEQLTERLVEREKVLEDALRYCRAGYSVIPVGRNKVSKIPWEEYINKRASEYEINDWWSKFPYANVALITGSISGFIVVDADGQEGIDALIEYIDINNSVCCETPNGGRHYYYVCPNSEITNTTRFLNNVDLRANKGYVLAPNSIGNNGKKYEWLLGHSIFEMDLPSIPKSLLEKLETVSKLMIALPQNESELFSTGRRDNDLFSVANTLFKSGMNYSLVEQTIARLASTCGFSQEEAKVKVDSALKRSIVRERNIKEEIHNFIEGTIGSFTLQDLYSFLNMTNKIEKFKANKVLQGFINDKYIERSSTVKNGRFRRIITEVEKIDFINVNKTFLDIHFPLNIDKFVNIMPGNIVIIAGTSNSGKSAMCLNLIKDNMDRFNINYFSSEMGSLEIHERLSKFGLPLESWKFNAYERSSDYQDCLDPEGINIIDYLSVTDEFYKMGAYIDQIYNKLKSGVAIICIQKNRGNDLGLGGWRSIEKSRLYININSDTIEIVKAKNFKNASVNPNGLRCNFHLENGCNFIEHPDGWFRIN